MLASVNIFDFMTHPIFTAIVIAVIVAHLLAVFFSFVVIGLFLWSMTRKDRWWTEKTWIATGAAVLYLGATAYLTWGT